MVVTKDQPHSPGRSVQMFIEVECEDHSAIQAPPPPKKKFNYLKINDAHPSVTSKKWPHAQKWFFSLEKWMILTPLQKLPNNVGNLG